MTEARNTHKYYSVSLQPSVDQTSFSVSSCGTPKWDDKDFSSSSLKIWHDNFKLETSVYEELSGILSSVWDLSIIYRCRLFSHIPLCENFTYQRGLRRLQDRIKNKPDLIISPICVEVCYTMSFFDFANQRFLCVCVCLCVCTCEQKTKNLNKYLHSILMKWNYNGRWTIYLVDWHW